MKLRITLFLFCFLMSGFCASIAAFADCSSGGKAGDIMYNKDYHVPQYCDGSVWMQMGQKQGVGGSGCAAPPVSLVQVQNNIDTSGTAFTAFSVNITTTPGDFLVAFVRESSNNTDTFTVTDSAGQTWTQTSSGYADESGTGPRTGMFYIANSAAVTSVTAHYTTGGGATKPGIMVMEFSNMAAGTVADGSVNHASLATATTSTSGSLTTSNANDILIFATDTSGDTSTSWTAGAGYTIPNYHAPPATGSSSYGDNIRMAVQWKSVSSVQTAVTTTMTYSPTNWNGNIFAAFKTGPSASEGDVIYNADKHVPQFCDGANWIPMAEGYPTTGLVGYWKLDDGSGTSASDSSGNGNPATLLNSPTWTTAGKLGGALTTTRAAASYASTASAGQTYFNQAPFSVSAWVKFNTLPSVCCSANGGESVVGADFTVSPWTPWNFFAANSNNFLSFTVTDASSGGHGIGSNSAMNAGQWYHIAATLDSKYNMKMYINGVQQSQTANSGSMYGGAAYIAIADGLGSDITTDDVRVYNRALSDTEIARLAMVPTAAACNPATTGLAGWWKLDETSGASAADSSGNGNTGTVSNGTWTTSGKIGGALTFNGSNSSLLLNSLTSFPTTGSFTVSAWINQAAIQSSGNYQMIMAMSDPSLFSFSWFLRTYNGCGTSGANVISFRVMGPSATSELCGTAASALSAASTWYHVVGVYDVSVPAMHIYVNGTLVDGSWNSPPGAPASMSYYATYQGTIGEFQSNGAVFNGNIDDVRVYSRALSASEIVNLYLGGKEGDITYNSDAHVPQYCDGVNWQQLGSRKITAPTGSGSGLAGWWKLDDGAGNVSDGENAANELGQNPASFTTGTAATTQAGASHPTDVAYDAVHGRLFVADTNNNRVLVYDTSAVSDGMNAVHELGQPSGTAFTSATAATTQSGMSGPEGLAWDSTNSRLFVADLNNSRVLEYDLSGGITDGMNAAHVLGQSNFTSSVQATTQSGMYWDYGVAYDSANNRLFVSDGSNNRVLEYDFAAPTTSGLVGWWKMDEGSGTTTADSSGTGNTGTLVNTPTWTTSGKINNALTFNGTSQYVNVPDSSSLQLSGSWTVSIWAKPAGTPTSGNDSYMICKQDEVGVNYCLGIGNDSWSKEWEVLVQDSTGNHYTSVGSNSSCCSGITLGNWYNVAGVYDSTAKTLSLYVNGVLKGTTGWTYTNDVSAGYPVLLGAWNSSSGFFNGSLDDGRVYNRALSAAEVAGVYNNGISDGMVASHVLGQANFTSGQYNRCTCTTPAANTMYGPRGLTYDPVNNRLFVGDANNNRVTEFDAATITDGMNATYELGQPSGTAFTTRGSATTQAGMQFPTGVGFDAAHDRLFVADYYNNRVTEFDLIGGITNGMNAAHVLGQGSFTAGANATTQAGLYYPYNSAYDAANSRLFVGDADNNRVLVFPATSSPTTAVDSSGNGHNGTTVNSPTWTTGKQGGALTLNGTNQYVTASMSLGAGDITVSGWMYPTAIGPGGYDDFFTEFDGGNNIHFWCVRSNPVGGKMACDDSGSLGPRTSSAIPLNQWTFFAVTRTSGAIFNLYINGVLDGTANQTGTATSSAGTTINIGSHQNNAAYSAASAFDDVRVYNRVLSATEIRDLYDATSN